MNINWQFGLLNCAIDLNFQAAAAEGGHRSDIDDFSRIGDIMQQKTNATSIVCKVEHVAAATSINYGSIKHSIEPQMAKVDLISEPIHGFP